MDIGRLEVLVRQLQGWLGRRERGVAALTWPGGSQFSNTLTVSHGLGVAPSQVQATAQGSFGGGMSVWTGAYTTIDFQIRASTVTGTPAAAATINVGWEATV